MPRSPERYLSFQSWLNRAGSKNVIWDIDDKNESVYRFSTVFMKFLRLYIKKLLYAHQRHKVHAWKNLMKNLMFRNNEYMKICFRKKPIRVTEDVFQEKRKDDFLNLAKLIEEIRSYHNLTEFPKEISKFIALLNDPIGNVHLIRSHYALHSFLKRVELVNYIQQQRENLKCRAFRTRTSFLDDEDLLMRHTKEPHFRNLFKGDAIFEVIFDRAYNVGETTEDSSQEEVHYMNTFGDLIRYIRNFMEHQGNVCTAKDYEWKVYCYFPFYSWLLCEKLAEVGLHPRLP